MSEQIGTCDYCGTGLDEDGRVAATESPHPDSVCREHVHAALRATKHVLAAAELRLKRLRGALQQTKDSAFYGWAVSTLEPGDL